MVCFCPSTLAEGQEDDDDLAANNEVIFVVDRYYYFLLLSKLFKNTNRSGSMSGSKMNQTKETLQFFLRSLPEGSFFNIISFGSSHSKLFAKSAKYDAASFKTASEHVNKIQADMGGTELLPVLNTIFSEALIQGIPRQVFLLTDGQVSNTDECIRTTQRVTRILKIFLCILIFPIYSAEGTRVFTFGIGGDVDRNLCNGIAAAGRGDCEFVDGTNMNRLYIFLKIQSYIYHLFI